MKCAMPLLELQDMVLYGRNGQGLSIENWEQTLQRSLAIARMGWNQSGLNAVSQSTPLSAHIVGQNGQEQESVP